MMSSRLLVGFAAMDGAGRILNGLAVASDTGELALAGDVLVRRKLAKNKRNLAGKKGEQDGNPSGCDDLADVDGPIELQGW